MKKIFALVVAFVLGAGVTLFAQDDAWKYEAVSVRYGNAPDGIKTTRDQVIWNEWKDCRISVKIDLDEKTFSAMNGSDYVHSISFIILDCNTDSNPANVLMSGFDIFYMDIAAIDWYLYKGQQHHVYLFYESGVAIEYLMKRL